MKKSLKLQCPSACSNPSLGQEESNQLWNTVKSQTFSVIYNGHLLYLDYISYLYFLVYNLLYPCHPNNRDIALCVPEHSPWNLFYKPDRSAHKELNIIYIPEALPILNVFP